MCVRASGWDPGTDGKLGSKGKFLQLGGGAGRGAVSKEDTGGNEHATGRRGAQRRRLHVLAPLDRVMSGERPGTALWREEEIDAPPPGRGAEQTREAEVGESPTLRAARSNRRGEKKNYLRSHPSISSPSALLK